MRARTLLALPLLLGAALSVVPSASADTQVTVTPISDGWYQANPTCALATGCLPPALPLDPPATTPFPARTLHVGAVAGQETARAVLAFDLSAVMATGGILTVPLDTDPSDGSASPESAKAIVCLTSSQWRAADGGLDEPPQADCATSAPLIYAATPAPHLQADLGRLVAGLPAATGLVLLPDAANLGPTDGWRVVFSAHDRAGTDKTAPASLLLTVPEAAAPPSFTPPIADPTLPEAQPPAVPGLAPLSPVQEPPAAVPSIAPTPATTLAPLAGPVLTSGHYPYLALGLLPLAALALTSFIGRALTMDLGAQAGRPRSG